METFAERAFEIGVFDPRNNRTGASQAVVGALPIDALVSAVERMQNAKP